MKTQEQADACAAEIEAVLERHGFVLSPESQCGLVMCDRDELSERDRGFYTVSVDLVKSNALP